MATSVIAQRGADPAAHLTHLVEPAHRITHVRPLSDGDHRGRVATAGRTAHGRLLVDQGTCSSSLNDTVAA